MKKDFFTFFFSGFQTSYKPKCNSIAGLLNPDTVINVQNAQNATGRFWGVLGSFGEFWEFPDRSRKFSGMTFFKGVQTSYKLKCNKTSCLLNNIIFINVQHAQNATGRFRTPENFPTPSA